jgi:hypothetical protein
MTRLNGHDHWFCAQEPIFGPVRTKTAIWTGTPPPPWTYPTNFFGLEKLHRRDRRGALLQRRPAHGHDRSPVGTRRTATHRSTHRRRLPVGPDRIVLPAAALFPADRLPRDRRRVRSHRTSTGVRWAPSSGCDVRRRDRRSPRQHRHRRPLRRDLAIDRSTPTISHNVDAALSSRTRTPHRPPVVSASGALA